MTDTEDFLLKKNRNIEENSELSEKSKRRLQKSKSANTVKAYSADWRDVTDWCEDHQQTALPAEPEQS